MANLAIKGHTTRGKEVVEILEMLGGKSYTGLAYKGEDPDRYYYIDKETNFINASLILKGFQVFPLEEFLEKFSYKVGDKVCHKGATSCGSIFEVEKMRWEENTVKYTLRLFGCNYKTSTLPAEYLQPYKEETMEEKVDKAKAPNLIDEDYYGKRFGYKIPNGYEFDCIKNNEIILKPKQPQYPKTYEECCDVLKIEYPYFKIEEDGISASTYKNKLFGDLKQLLICRDAYWKIAGEQMGLDKPWEPKKAETVHTIIYDFYDEVIDVSVFDLYDNVILCFPTEEMRDAFYENFNNLINKCKELL